MWITNDSIYRPARGDTGLRLEPRHLRGNVFPSLYRAMKADVRRVNETLLGAAPQAGNDIASWEKTMRALCGRRQWLRLFIQNGGLSTVAPERDEAESRVNWQSNLQIQAAQAQSDARQIQVIGAAIQRGAYKINPERLVPDMMEVIRADITKSAITPPASPSPDDLSRKENVALNRALDPRS